MERRVGRVKIGAGQVRHRCVARGGCDPVYVEEGFTEW